MLPVYSVQIPNPFFEGRTAVYVIGSRPLTLIDTGISSDKAYTALRDGLAEHNLSVRDIGRIILTHKHIDHIGNAWKIQRETGAEILIHESELTAVTNVDPEGKRFAQLSEERFEEWRVPLAERPKMQDIPRWPIEPVDARGLSDGQEIQLEGSPLKVIHTPGHTLGSICLKYGSYLFTGDHVLPDISPNIGAGDLRERGLLQKFLKSLEHIQQVQATQIMPGHGHPFTDLTGRCRALAEHHEQRLKRIIDILRPQEMTVFEVARALFGELADFHVLLGCAEANAHLEYLADERRVELVDGHYRRVP